MTFGSPWSDTYPTWIWKRLQHSRKDKDIFEPVYKLIQGSRLYPLVFKSYPRYWAFGVGASIFVSYYWAVGCNQYWMRRNSGRLYADCPYVYPEEED